MNNKLSKYLSQPTPVNDRPWLSVLLCVATVVFILAVFEPFDFKLNSSGQAWVLVGFALIMLSATSIVFVLFPKIFKRFYNPNKWTVGRSLLNNVFLLLLIGIGVVCYDYFIVMKQLPEYFPMGFLVDLFAALTIGIVPISIITIIIQNRALKRNLCESKEMNQKLSERVKSDTKEIDSIVLNSSTKESVTVRPEDLLYMEASGNYVNVYYKQDHKVKQKSLRSTIKQMEDLLLNQTIFIRCHRAFIVNINHPSFHVQPIIRNSDQPWFLPKKRLSFAVIFLLGNSSYISGSCVLENTSPRLLFSSFDNAVFPEIIKVPIGYYCEFSEEFLKRDRTFDLTEAYGSLALKHSSIPIKSDNAVWLAHCFEKMYTTQQSQYIFKYDLIRNYLSLIIHEGLRNKGNRYANA